MSFGAIPPCSCCANAGGTSDRHKQHAINKLFMFDPPPGRISPAFAAWDHCRYGARSPAKSDTNCRILPVHLWLLPTHPRIGPALRLSRKAVLETRKIPPSQVLSPGAPTCTRRLNTL